MYFVQNSSTFIICIPICGEYILPVVIFNLIFANALLHGRFCQAYLGSQVVSVLSAYSNVEQELVFE